MVSVYEYYKDLKDRKVLPVCYNKYDEKDSICVNNAGRDCAICALCKGEVTL